MPITVPYAPQQIYQPNGRLVDLIRLQGQDAARAAEIRGQQQAQLWGGVGNSIGNVANTVLAATDPRRKFEEAQAQLAQGHVADANAMRVGQRAVDAMMSGNQLQPGEAGPQQESFLDSSGLFDVPKMTKALASSGMAHLAPDLLKGAESINDAVLKHQDLEQKAAQQKTLMIGDLANGALKLADIGMPIDKAMDFVVQPALATKRIQPQEYAQLRSQIGSLPPEQQKAALTSFMDAAEKLDKGDTLAEGAIHVGRYGRTEAANPKTEKPTEASIALEASGGDAAKAMSLLKPGPKSSIEEEWLARDRRLATAKNGGKPLTDEQLKAVDTASMQQFAQSKADPEVRAAALAQKAIAASLANMQIGMMPTKEQAIDVAKDVVEHRIAPEQLAALFSTRGKEGLAFKLNVASEAKKLDPEFNWEKASSEYQLSKSTGFQNTVRYMDSALESIPQLLKNSKNLGNGDWRSLNQIANAAASQFNSTDLKRFKTDALLVGDEIAKILSGGGTGSATSDAKLKQATDIIGTSDSVPAIAAAMDEVQALMGNRRRALTRGTYMEGTSAAKPSPAVLPPGVTVVKR